MTFHLPPRGRNHKGKERQVGVEFEFSGITTHEAAEIILGLWGGRIVEKNRFTLTVKKTELGDFSVELDAQLLKNEDYLDVLKKCGIKTGQKAARDKWEEWIETTASVLVPYEIGSPPLPLSQLPEMEKLRQALRKRHALGTKARIHYAFGMHLNPETPDFKPRTILNILRSFVLHHPWLVRELKVDWARRVTPFINAFPDDYLKLILDPAYDPDQSALVKDYLKHNPTRNRPLDMLPLFCFLEEKKVRRALPKEKIKARPTFHYRMPNCLLDDPKWRIAKDWNYWVSVEKLAENPERLDRISLLLLDKMEKSPLLWNSRWARHFSKELKK